MALFHLLSPDEVSIIFLVFNAKITFCGLQRIIKVVNKFYFLHTSLLQVSKTTFAWTRDQLIHCSKSIEIILEKCNQF